MDDDTQEKQQTMLMMKRLLVAVKTTDDVIEPHIAIPALNFTLGFVLGQALENGIDGAALAEVYGNVINEVDYARRTASAVSVTYDAIDKARH